jgi:two-component system CheB/CheR fusion protein
MTTSTPDTDFEALLRHLKETRGFDFTAYKRTTLMRRVQKRLAALSIDTYTDYIDFLEVHQEEFAALFNTILINVTSFFRDQAAWDFLNRELIPRILASKLPEDPIRVWCAGCASGEEAYSIGMLLAEAMGPDAFRQRVKIYATDVDEDSLSTARQGIYGSRDMSPVSEEYRERYFERIGDRYMFKRDYRRVIIFGRHDLIQDAPISRIDLLISRNTMMYFNSDAQARIIARFFYALNEGGYLFLGKAETLLAHTHIFAPVDLKFRLFAKPWSKADIRQALFGAVGLPDEKDEAVQDHERIRDLAFQEDPAAQLVVDLNLILTLANETARNLFGLATKDVGRPLQDLEVSYQPVELRSLISKVVSDRQPIVRPEVAHNTAQGMRWFDVRLQPLLDGAANMLAVKISFLDVTRPRELAEELQQSRSDLETAYEELQSSNEELETTNEELQSTVEELETTNEELQSTNEELETMNEELQSTNEELETVNEELRERGVQLNTSNSFLESVLTSLRVGVVVIDYNLLIRAWNSRAEDLWGVRSDEVQNTHFMNLDIGLRVESLAVPIRDCLTGRKEYDEVFEATNRRGRAILCRVSLSPLREIDQRITGAVILMEEVEAPNLPDA